MNRLIELLGGHSKPVTAEASSQQEDAEILSLIEPATGEEKEKIERDCAEYLQNPDQNSVTDFSNFTSNMILLIGGKRREEKSGYISDSSDPLLDQETQTSILFRVGKSNPPRLTMVKIETQSADKVEKLSVNFFPPIKIPSFIPEYTMNATSRKTPPPTFDSYITGQKEPGSTVIGSIDMDPNEAKGFAQRVFSVYKRQGQQAQPPTPQN